MLRARNVTNHLTSLSKRNNSPCTSVTQKSSFTSAVTCLATHGVKIQSKANKISTLQRARTRTFASRSQDQESEAIKMMKEAPKKMKSNEEGEREGEGEDIGESLDEHNDEPIDTTTNNIQEVPAPKDIFAVVKLGAHQYKITNGDLITSQKLQGAEVGDKIHLEKVMLLGGKTFTLAGQPLVPGARVLATVEEQTKLAKQIVFKKKRRKNYRRWRGVRHPVTVLRINDIEHNTEGMEENAGKVISTE